MAITSPITISTRRCLRIKAFIRSKLGIRLLCVKRWIGLSNARISAGRTITTVITPSTTPFAITRPMSRPSVSRMKHSARKPKIVVSELPDRERKVLDTARAIASRWSPPFSRSSSYRSTRKTE